MLPTLGGFLGAAVDLPEDARIAADDDDQRNEVEGGDAEGAVEDLLPLGQRVVGDALHKVCVNDEQ